MKRTLIKLNASMRTSRTIATIYMLLKNCGGNSTAVQFLKHDAVI